MTPDEIKELRELIEFLKEYDIGDFEFERGDFKMVAAPYVCAGETLPREPAPALGQDTERLLAECGLSRETVADLRRRGVI